MEVFPRFGERSALSIGARKFLDKANVSFRNLLEYGGELQGHTAIIRTGVRPNKPRQPAWLSCGE